MIDKNRETWNKHKWRRDTSWWDNLEVPLDELKENHQNVFDWLELIAPDPYEHDYILYTDGSGCSEGWGAYTALYEKIELVDQTREPVDCGLVVSSTYGSTVQRSEFNAFLDGVYKILTEQCAGLKARAEGDSALEYAIGTEGELNQFRGPDRISILWYTDRNNLAQSLLFDETGTPLFSRTKDRDLWMRWAFMAKYVCVTPMCRARNSILGQAACDKAAGVARLSLKSAKQELADATQHFYENYKWLQKQPQTARF